VAWSACRVGLRQVVDQIVSNQDERVQQNRISNTYHYMSEATGRPIQKLAARIRNKLDLRIVARLNDTEHCNAVKRE